MLSFPPRNPNYPLYRYNRRPGIPAPDAYTDGMGFAQIFDSGINPKSQMTGQRAIVWGAYAANVPGVFSCVYQASTRYVGSPAATYDIRWMEQNHPDWIVYNNDRATPHVAFYYPAIAAGFFYVFLDFTNQEVRDYMLATALTKLAPGYPAIAFDNVSFHNSGATIPGKYNNSIASGVWRGATYDGSGVRTGGTWVQLFEGKGVDVRYQNAFNDYLSWMRKQLNDRGYALIVNCSTGTVGSQLEDHKKILAFCDGWLNESQPLHPTAGRTKDQTWINYFHLITEFALDGGVWMNDPLGPANTLAGLSDADVSWAIGNFLLMRGPRSYGSLHGAFSVLQNYSARFTANVGAPTSKPFKYNSTYRRNYAKGLIFVNPFSTSAFNITVPAGTWTDIFGATVAPGVQSLAASSSLVLVSPTTVVLTPDDGSVDPGLPGDDPGAVDPGDPLG